MPYVCHINGCGAVGWSVLGGGIIPMMLLVVEVVLGDPGGVRWPGNDTV